MEKTNFESLRVYRLSEELADKIWKTVRDWNNFDKDTVGKQIVRSTDSIGANIAEGAGRYTFTEISDSRTLPEGRFMKQNIGFVAPLREIYCRNNKLKKLNF